jgi:hypothetical protein
MVLQFIHREAFSEVVSIRFKELFNKTGLVLGDFSGYVRGVGRQPNEPTAKSSRGVPGFAMFVDDLGGWNILYDAEIESLHVFSQFAVECNLCPPNSYEITFIPS